MSGVQKALSMDVLKQVRYVGLPHSVVDGNGPKLRITGIEKSFFLQLSLASNPDADFRFSAIFTQIGVYKGRIYAVKQSPKMIVDITRKLKKELKVYHLNFISIPLFRSEIKRKLFSGYAGSSPRQPEFVHWGLCRARHSLHHHRVLHQGQPQV